MRSWSWSRLGEGCSGARASRDGPAAVAASSVGPAANLQRRLGHGGRRLTTSAARPPMVVRWPAALLLATTLALTTAPPLAAAPDEEALGKAAGYPIGTARNWFYDEHVRVGSFSHLDRIQPHNTLAAASMPSALPPARNELELTYRFEGKPATIQTFLDRQRITGLLIIKDGAILLERYQYDRTAAHRMVSHSIAKSIVSLGIGIAVQDGLIRSLDDRVARYVPELAGAAYGETSIRNLLRMSSGVRFSENYDGKSDSDRFWRTKWENGTIAALRAFDAREAPAGSRFHYASSETVALALVLARVAGTTVSDFIQRRLWQPMGAEAAATWVRTHDGLEIGAGSFNAVLRDYGRLGVLLAGDGALAGRQVIPRQYLIEATDWQQQPEPFRPGRATRYFGYGYQLWLFPGAKRRFALLGVYGQTVFVDPELRLVLVITAAARHADVAKDTLGRERDALWRALVAHFGAW